MLGRILGLFRPKVEQKPMGPPAIGRIRASYDSVARTVENARHWQWADYLSADSALRTDVRQMIRSQARYEIQENNCYGLGLATTLVTDTIGTGPRIQISAFSQTENQKIEFAFHNWMRAVGLCDKLATIRMAKLVDGEAVARFVTNILVDDPVSLDLQLIECDQLASPNFEAIVTDKYVDGVILDRFGNPIAYDILKHHPGSNYGWSANQFEFDRYSATQIIHAFKCNRPGQHRGVSEFAPALPLFAFLRRFTLATVSAAETAASVSQVITTDAPIPDELEEEFSAATFDKFMEAIPIDRNSATVLPNMWKMQQFAAEHPVTTYQMFKRELVSEIGRTIGMPANIALADSGQSNYSSARFDHLGYERTIKREQNYLSRVVLDRVFAEWLLEASLVGAVSSRVRDKVLLYNDRFGRRGLASQIEHAWHWDGLRDADQRSAAQAERVKMQNGTTHRARAYAEQGLDVEVEDLKAAESLGMTVDKYREWVAASIFTNGNLINQQPGEQNDEAPTEDSDSEEAETEATAET